MHADDFLIENGWAARAVEDSSRGLDLASGVCAGAGRGLGGVGLAENVFRGHPGEWERRLLMHVITTNRGVNCGNAHCARLLKCL